MTTNSTPSKTKKFTAGAGLLVAGLAAGAMFSPIGLAGAQETDTDTDAPATDAPATEDGEIREGRRGQRGEAKRAVLNELGVSDEALEAGKEADQTLSEIAAAAGVSEADLVAALTDASTERIAEAVESGRITQEEADAKLAELDAKIAERISTSPSERQAEREARRAERQEARFAPLEGLGLTMEQVQEGREAGQTLAETAEANGVDQNALVDALVEAAMERADAAVEDGRATQEEADERLVGIEERVTERVNSEPGERDGGRRGPGRGGRGGDAPAEAPADA